MEKAVGVDTATRTQTVWQVKVYPPPGSDVGLKGPITCDTPDGDITGWVDFRRPQLAGSRPRARASPRPTTPASSRRLAAPRVREPALPGRGPRPRRARGGHVQVVARQRVHRDERAGHRRRWDRAHRDAYRTRCRPPVQHRRLGRGDGRRARAVRPAGRHAQGRAGRRRRFDPDAHDGTAGGHFDATDPLRHTRIKRWDQKGIVRDAAQNAVDDVDANGGVIKVPAAATALVIEDGIQVTLSVDPAGRFARRLLVLRRSNRGRLGR